MNRLHHELLATDEWRDALVQHVLPFAFGDLSVADLGDDVLEVGPGPGLTTDLLHPSLHKVTSIEIDPELATALASRLERTNVEVVTADATAMPFEDGRFSGAVTFTMFHHVPTLDLQDQLIAEVARVLRPGGRLLLVDMLPHDREEYQQQMGHVWLGFSDKQISRYASGAGFGEVRLRALPVDPDAKGPALFAAVATKTGS